MTQAELESEFIALRDKFENLAALDTKRSENWRKVRRSARLAAWTYRLVAIAYFSGKIGLSALQIEPMKQTPLDYLFMAFVLTAGAIRLQAEALRDPGSIDGWWWGIRPFR